MDFFSCYFFIGNAYIVFGNLRYMRQLYPYNSYYRNIKKRHMNMPQLRGPNTKIHCPNYRMQNDRLQIINSPQMDIQTH
jgi:hypothetical protein